MNIAEWIKSKKTKHMLATQSLIAGVIVAVLIVSKGDPEKARELLAAVQNALIMLAGVGATTIGSQAHVDGKLAANGKK